MSTHDHLADLAPLFHALGHPLRIHVLLALRASDGERRSPKQLARDVDQPLGNVAYHVRILVAAGLLEPAGEEQRRGAMEHFYRLPERAEWLLDLVDPAKRREMVAS